MSSQLHIERLLRWRLERAEMDAPPPPRAAHLIALSRPWWESWPERFHAQVQRLTAIPQVAYGHAMMDVRQDRTGHPVTTLIVHTVEEFETSARILYFSIKDGRLRLRFQLDAGFALAERIFEVTFVSDDAPEPIFSANATSSVDNEYRVDAELPAQLAREWADVKVTDRMPFRFILHSLANHG
ncbi:MAG: hypothetical protein ABI664_02805 [bacterium]